MLRKSVLLPLCMLAVLGAGCMALVTRTFMYPLPAARISPLAQYTMLDMTAVLGGVRRLGADIAWIQLLQYYGTPEKPLDKETEYRLSWDMTKYLAGMPVQKEVCFKEGCHDEHHYHSQLEGGVYPDFLSYCYRIVRLDPFFDHAYLYGAGALAWNLNRPQEALELLQNGMQALEKYGTGAGGDIHQPFWQLSLYASAIIYRQSGDFEKMQSLLEVAVRQSDCPNMVKAILGNIYQKEGRTMDSLALWLAIYDSGDPSYRDRAGHKIEELRGLLKIAS